MVKTVNLSMKTNRIIISRSAKTSNSKENAIRTIAFLNTRNYAWKCRNMAAAQKEIAANTLLNISRSALSMRYTTVKIKTVWISIHRNVNTGKKLENVNLLRLVKDCIIECVNYGRKLSNVHAKIALFFIQ